MSYQIYSTKGGSPNIATQIQFLNSNPVYGKCGCIAGIFHGFLVSRGSCQAVADPSKLPPQVWCLQRNIRIVWVAVKELNLSYYIGETLLFTIYTHYGNLMYVP